ncbi:uncharacterized protein LOC131316417 isoform X2 [Rhododendron vialii]|uniref:uncharacterized protein LOC131316417 isoform X2 n=1 Tax=Rhododendron vialii TaxID=182163 RepID=UPI00265E1B42|nr:uncharacterized protein LOC131316417 isoform X2 [Rhododendron vialii]
MVAKMMKWSPWPPPSAAAAKKFLVKAKQIKLQGFVDDGADDDRREKVMAVEMKWKGGPKHGLVPLIHRPTSKQRRKHVSGQTLVKQGEPIDWDDDEFDNTCSFSTVAKESTFGPWEVSFTLLYGAKTESKLAVVGKASLNLGELASKMEAQIEAKVPVNFNVAGGANGEATLSVCFSFVEVRDSQDSPGIVQNSTESKNMEGPKGDELAACDKERLKSPEEASADDDSDESAMFDSDVTSENELVSTSNGVDVTTSVSVKKAGFFSWKRRRLSFRPGKTKGEPLIKRTRDDDDLDSVNPYSRPEVNTIEQSCKTGENSKEKTSTSGYWEEKELTSRDGETKLKTDVFFASFDQRSDKAAGESACTALVAVIAHWLHSNQEGMPTRPKFDRLIIEGSSEWRNLCGKEDLINQYPNKHFDLETVMQAGIRPVSVLPEKSFVGFFGPEKFQSLKGCMSFDQIWDEIKGGDENNRPTLYIVSWNDHFFVLKVDSDAYYIIDTLGERLYEGCDRAYIMRFDDSTVMKGKVDSEGVGSSEPTKVDRERVGSEEPTNSGDVSEGEICRGKECCREFIKRFFAAIPLRELESEEEKEPVSYFALHQRLQIEFNFSSSLSSSSSVSSLATSTSVSSLFSESSLATSSVSSIFSEESADL